MSSSYPTPSSLYGAKNTFWTPTTPTPSHALRPSLSLHNLESKVFTEVLIPTIRPPQRHQVSPQEPSPRSPRLIKFSPSFNERNPRKSFPGPSDKNCLGSFERQTVPTVLSPPTSSTIPSTAQPFKAFSALGRLSEISENVIFMKCS